ncbi:MAG TPA: 16S rRNA (uracil(1498)-N(3))-methyltransferase [Woeseiaceae bacterium]
MGKKASNRLYVPGPLTPGSELTLDEERTRYISAVLRLRVGEELALFDGRGGEFAAIITEASRRAVILHIGAHRAREFESPLRIHLVQGVSRGERMDLVVQKATELGVHRITPVLAGRSVVQLDGAKSSKRAAHWAKVAQSACEQCGRNVVPLIDTPQSFASWLAAAGTSDAQRVVLRPGAARTLTNLEYAGDVWQVLIGPEGGLSDTEVAQAVSAGFVPCVLGPRVLRTETAAIAALAILQDRYGDLG